MVFKLHNLFFKRLLFKTKDAYLLINALKYIAYNNVLWCFEACSDLMRSNAFCPLSIVTVGSLSICLTIDSSFSCKLAENACRCSCVLIIVFPFSSFGTLITQPHSLLLISGSALISVEITGQPHA